MTDVVPPTFETFLRGTSFRPIEAKVVVKELEEGAPLMVERDHENEYDSNAIKVIEPDSSEFIGFVAREDAREIAGWMDEGWHFSCHARERVSTYVFLLFLEPILPAKEEVDAEEPIAA